VKFRKVKVEEKMSSPYQDLYIRRLEDDDIGSVMELMQLIVSLLPSSDYYAMDDSGYFREHIRNMGELYGAFADTQLVAVTVLGFPGPGPRNLAREYGVPERELLRVAALEGSAVHPSARGKGLQRFFVELRERRAAEYGCLHMYSTVHPDNEASRRNLELSGYEWKFSRSMYGGLPRHCYAKRLNGHL
jgi:GNAT superfamily N-acetyltransferase